MPSLLRERAKALFSMIPWEAVAACIILIFYGNYILAYFPLHGLWGHDWQYVLPSLLDGYYSSITEGYLHIPWFTPAFCGGLPKFPNPQDMYFTLPQWLMLFLAPIDAVRVTVLLFGAAGFAGTYLLLRSVFRCGKAAALFGAAVFLFNGFYAVGMIMGHVTKHAFMLLPLCAHLVIRAGSTHTARAAAMAAGAAACFAYTIHTGGFVLVLIMFVAIFGIGLLAALSGVEFSFVGSAAATAAAAVFAMLLSAAKIAAVLSFMQFFPRDFYTLPGIPNPADMPLFFIKALFGDFASLAESDIFVSDKWVFALHEFNFGITWVPAILIAAGCAASLKNMPPVAKMPSRAIPAGVALLFVMALPLALNYLSPSWQVFLKSVPVIKNSSGNLRWFAVYIPLFSVLAAMSLQKVFGDGVGGSAAGMLGIAAIVAITMFTGPSYDFFRRYNPATIAAAYHIAAKTGAPPRVNGIAAIVSAGGPVRATGRNDFLAIGKSSFLCYEPVFGYTLEAFPFKTLHVGPVTDVVDGALNLKNPACFVFPGENGCAPGDHFKTEEREKVMLFTAYRDFDFKMSARQRIANVVSLASWLLLIGASLYWAVRKVIRKPFP